MNINKIQLPQTIKGFNMVNSEFGGEESSYDEISIVLEQQIIRIFPLTETDEIEIKISANFQKLPPGNISYSLSSFVGKRLMSHWSCTNSQGYFDLFILGVEALSPSIYILSEGSSLKIRSI